MLSKRQKEGHIKKKISQKRRSENNAQLYETERKTTELFVSRAQLMDPVYPQLGFC